MPCSHDHCGGSHAAERHSRRSIVIALASAAIASANMASAKAAPAFAYASAEDEQYMRMALEEARQGDYPFGAVIVRDGKLVARGRNLGKTNDDPTAHGEMVAIRRCLAEHGSAALRGSTLYTSGEPCVMCMGAIIWCGIGRLVFAASVTQIGSKMNQIMIASAEIAAKASFDPISITGGVMADEAVQMFGQ
jgi:tRNA(Arg) A34 adenosine deaminase TadA